MDFDLSVNEFHSMLHRISSENVLPFLGWLKNNLDDFIDKAKNVGGNEKEVIFNSIRDDIRESLPQNSLSPTENILTPTVGNNSDCDPSTTVHVDAFLYDEDTVDSLCDEGRMSRNYCTQCGSQDIKPLTFITHSASVQQIKYMFQFLLPDLRGKTIVDVGSRTGAILYGAYLYSNAENIIGVEIDVNFCQLQQSMIEKYNMTDRIKILHNDILNCSDLLQSADVVVLNNVFEFFIPLDTQERIWNFLHDTVRRSGSLLVTVPSIEESLQHLKTEVKLVTWLKQIETTSTQQKANVMLYGNEEHEDSDLGNIFLYQIL